MKNHQSIDKIDSKDLILPGVGVKCPVDDGREFIKCE